MLQIYQLCFYVEKKIFPVTSNHPRQKMQNFRSNHI